MAEAMKFVSILIVYLYDINWFIFLVWFELISYVFLNGHIKCKEVIYCKL